ncbi:AhpA/YtjB family protein [Aliidiomarina haloalkalitolerans]|uniref:Uncharacterized protein n=1 Tax=Aliidiomarina haloalkalitolerans TaxID=859059 RepID=A0A432VR00_9GAMM|nr:AhpA/YtjB family protein [Aliidiomarina haloalkalitolerans]RUO18593.1 hypothetical protein CWE06_10115 [Aliidiomarina haloalkalitolerans]
MNLAHQPHNPEFLRRPWIVPGERYYRRVVIFIVATLLLLIIANVWLQANKKGEEVIVAHTENLAKVILAQAEHEARVWFLSENPTGLVSLANHLQSQETILEVSIQDQQGRNLVRAGHDLPIHDYLRQLPQSMWAVPMVAPVYDRSGAESQLLGFVRITFDYDRITAQSRPYHRVSGQQQLVGLGMAFLAGMLVAFGVLRRRRPIPVPAEADAADQKPEQPAKQPAD